MVDDLRVELSIGAVWVFEWEGDGGVGVVEYRDDGSEVGAEVDSGEYSGVWGRSWEGDVSGGVVSDMLSEYQWWEIVSDHFDIS